MYEYNGDWINRRVWAFFIPGLIATISITLSMFLDILLVGRMVGPMEMGAVQMAMPVTMLFNMIYMLLGTGGEVLVASAKGERDPARANTIFTLTMAAALLTGAAVAVLGSLFAAQTAAFLDKGNAEMTPLVARYIRIMFLGAPIIIGVMSCTPFVKADAMPKLSAFVAVFSNIVNIVSKMIYMGPLKLGLDGAALGTVTGYAAGLALLSLCYLLNGEKRVLRFVPLSAKDFKKVGDIFLTGLPSSLGQGLGALNALVSNAIVLSIAGSKGIVALTVASSCTIFISSFRYASPMAIVPLVGAMYGERDWWSMIQTAKRVLFICIAGTALCVLFFELFPKEVLLAFGVKDKAVMAMGVTALRFFSLNVLFTVMIHIIMTYYQTTGRKTVSIAISAGTELADIACRYLCGMIFGLIGVWASPLLGSALLLISIYGYARWVEKKTAGAEISYHGAFLLHERAPAFVEKNTLIPDKQNVLAFAEQERAFIEKSGASAEAAKKAGTLIEEALLQIIAKNSAHIKSVDVMTVVWKGGINIRLRDDGPKFAAAQNKNDSITHASIIGY
ncbi:MAG: MATE family efflux transporter, partial [Cloacibacillus sp.]